MALNKEALTESLNNVGIQSDMLSLLSTMETAASALNALSGLVAIPSIDAALAAAQQAAITASMTAISNIASKFAPNLLDLTGELLTVMANPIGASVTAFNTLTEDLNITLPGDAGAFSVTAAIGIVEKGIATSALDVASTYVMDGVDNILPEGILSGETGGLLNPYKHLGNYSIIVGAAGIANKVVKLGVPALTPSRNPEPDLDFPTLEKEMPIMAVPDIQRKIFGDYTMLA